MSLVAERVRLAAPLDERWRALLEGIAKGRGYPSASDPVRLGAAVAKLSEAYNAGSGMLASSPATWAARLSFSFARDVPKSAAAIAELLLTRSLAMPIGGRVDVLDLGAGLGATTWGVVRAFAAYGASGLVRAHAIDPDREALSLATTIAKSAAGEGSVKLELTTNEGSLDSPKIPARHRYQLVLLGQMLSEADVSEGEDARVEKHAEKLRHLLDAHVAKEGSLVVVEPALRDRTRHLHRVRDRLVALGHTVFAPCLHDAPCPMLRREEDWCHEDLAIDLPDWLVPVAKAAGLRREGLTFSYLVVRPDGLTLRARTSDRRALRLVASPKVTKGKCELSLCGETASGPDLAVPMRLDRHRDEALTGAMDEAVRGDLVIVTPQPPAGPSRLAPDATVTLGEVSEAP